MNIFSVYIAHINELYHEEISKLYYLKWNILYDIYIYYLRAPNGSEKQTQAICIGPKGSTLVRIISLTHMVWWQEILDMSKTFFFL